MAYEPKTWVCGEKITADDLNHMEQGIANAGGGGTDTYEVYLGEFQEEYITNPKVWASASDILTAIEDGKTIEIKFSKMFDEQYASLIGFSNPRFYNIERTDDENRGKVHIVMSDNGTDKLFTATFGNLVTEPMSFDMNGAPMPT